MNTNNDRLSDPMQTTGSIRLPFPVLRIDWFNGKSGVDPEKYPVSHYGGWYAQTDKAGQVLAETGAPMLGNFPMVDMIGEKGSFRAYASRTVTVCPILKRVGWFTDDQGRPYSALQLLAWAAVPNVKTKIFDPWGPVLLKSKSLSGLAITNALYNWGQKITRYLPKDNSAPAWAHWVTLGTVRATVYTEERGKGKNTRLATPCEFYWVEDKSEAFVAGRFIGGELLAKYTDVRMMAQDWADSWNTKYNQKRTGSAVEEAEDDGVSQPPDNYPDADSVPF